MQRPDFIKAYVKTVKLIGGEAKTTVVSGGGALLMPGLRTGTDDLDLDVPEAVFNKHKTPANTEYFGETVIVNYSENVSLHVINPSIKTMVVDGVTIYSIDELIDQKRKLSLHPERKPNKVEQDKKDIAALEKLTKSTSLKW